ncbi:MAG: DNA repair protein [Pseudooceanicola sp.]
MSSRQASDHGLNFPAAAVRVFQPVAMAALMVLTLALCAAALLAGFGVIARPELPLAWNGAPVDGAGMWLLGGAAVFTLGLCAFLPTNGRIMALERAHRDFSISMHDVARAYHAAHAADRQGAFRLSGEFDAVRERIAFLRAHPDLGALEPEVLEAAAQMSHVSRELADTYSEEKVNRARAFLRQRQEELEDFNDRLDTAKALTHDLRHWVEAVEMEEAVARSQLGRLKAELDDVLPELNLGLAGIRDAAADAETAEDKRNVVGMMRPAAE